MSAIYNLVEKYSKPVNRFNREKTKIKIVQIVTVTPETRLPTYLCAIRNNILLEHPKVWGTIPRVSDNNGLFLSTISVIFNVYVLCRLLWLSL